jgi:2-polyprenyl-3-methyl-5-hydroxy-6-metoxy-1,4-benzoquinol methylase
MSDQRTIEETAELYDACIIKGWEMLYQEKRKRLYRIMSDYFIGDSVLEMGSGDGEITRHLFDRFKKVTVVDASEKFLNIIRHKIKNDCLQLVQAYFEDYKPSSLFGTILMTHILEHLDDPVLVLRSAYSWLTEGGRAIISVPNANSLHRQIGVKMGLLPSCDSLNEQDRMLGHRRIYTPQLMEEHIKQSDFRIIKFTGLMLKNLSNRQIQQQWSPELIDAHFQLGFDYPELCSEIIYILER